VSENLKEQERAVVTFDFRGQTVIVTGGAQGIGCEIARQFAQAGASVVLADYLSEDAESTAAEFRAGGLDAVAFGVDVTDEQAVSDLMNFAQNIHGNLRILVNCAGVSTTQVVAETDLASWQRVLNVNLTGPFLTSKAIVPILRDNGGGKIINVASVAAKRISNNAGASYTASKEGLLGFTRHLAYEVAADNINVNAICPGPVLSPMLERTASREAIAMREAGVPSLKISSPTDQANVVLFLASPLADMVYGIALDVDGGALLGWYDIKTYFARRNAKEVPVKLRG
jgi:NAD(P)-dependent dehydrogenase (short-subunit alcohol dehydrogenase family)